MEKVVKTLTEFHRRDLRDFGKSFLQPLTVAEKLPKMVA
jgi:hypothetical protein